MACDSQSLRLRKFCNYASIIVADKKVENQTGEELLVGAGDVLVRNVISKESELPWVLRRLAGWR